MSVLIDLKRRSPTIPERRNIVEFASAAKFAELLTIAGADGFLVNTDEMEYGGKFTDLKETAKATRATKPINAPCIINKDIIIHPVQVREALLQDAFLETLYNRYDAMIHRVDINHLQCTTLTNHLMVLAFTFICFKQPY
jgi:indole-3-glycerol phosphate synthase